jgi:uncharacterized protein (TIGR02147 family)
VKQEPQYRLKIQSVYQERVNRNPRYSLRAFARDLDILPSRLNEILKGRCGLSPEAGHKLAERIGLSSTEAQEFIDEIEALHGRSRLQRQTAKQRQISRPSPVWMDLQLDAFKAISDWWHFAILELTSLKDFESSAVWISKRLGISASMATEAVERLKKLELLEEQTLSGKKIKWVATEDYSAVGGAVPSEAIRKFHRQILERAMQAIDFQGIEQRVLGATVMAVKKDRIKEATQALTAFRKDFNKKFGGADQSDAVYCLALQFFELTQNAK